MATKYVFHVTATLTGAVTTDPSTTAPVTMDAAKAAIRNVVREALGPDYGPDTDGNFGRINVDVSITEVPA